MSRSWEKGSTYSWRRVRSAVLTRDGQQCKLQLPGCTGRATHVDHIVPKSKGGTDHPSNLRASCQHCNLRRGTGTKPNLTPTGGTRWDNTTPTPTPDRTVILIVGPAGSGKTTLAKTLGLRHLEREQHHSDQQFTDAASRAAHAPGARIVVVRACPTPADQEYWRAMLNATRVIVMPTSEAECMRRCRQRARPGWQGEIASVRAWFAARRTSSHAAITTDSNPRPDGGTQW
jgi:5-methylcytosine-specific restriction protein A